MSRTTRRMAVAVAAVAAVALTGCSASGGDTGSTSGPIKIGGTLALTGSLATTGQEYNGIYQYWADKVNAAGGLLGRPVELDIKNDNSTAATAQTEYQTLLTRDQVDLVLAPYATFVGAPIVPLARSAGKVLFNGGFVSKDLFAQADGGMVGTFTFQEPDNTRGLFEAARQLPEGKRPTRVGILTNNNPFTLGVRDGYQGQGGALKYAAAAGMQVVYNETYGSDTSDFTAAINQAKAANVDLFLALSLPNDAANILKTANVLQFKPRLTCACGSQVSTLGNWKDLGAATEGVVSTTVAWSTQDNKGLSDVTAFARSKGHDVIPAYDAIAYADLQVLQQAVEGTRSLDQAKIKDYLHANTFDTAVGKLRFEADGTPQFSQVLTQTRNGVTSPVWPAGVATEQLVVGGSAA